MKKSIRHILSFVFALVLAAAVMTASAFAAEAPKSKDGSRYMELKNIPDTFLYIMQAHPIVDQGPIVISQATLKENGTETPVYFVALHGTEVTDFGEAVGVKEDLQSGFDKDNTYVRSIVKAIEQDVPKGSNLVLAGHSLGGMAAQQVASNQTIKDDYNVLYTTAIASPLIDKDQPEGKLNRLGDKNDAVPWLSSYTLSDREAQEGTCQKEDSSYNITNAHTHSYEDTSIWGNYDAVGNKGGNAELILDTATSKVHYAPSNESNSNPQRIYFGFPWDGNNYQGISVLY